MRLPIANNVLARSFDVTQIAQTNTVWAGSQYASEEFTALLAMHGLVPSMSRKGDCWDNAVVESFFGSMKTELGDPIFESRVAARARLL